jgi:hypothetical protein
MKMDGNGASKRQKWAAVYGAVVAGLSCSDDDPLTKGMPPTPKQMRTIVLDAGLIADAAISAEEEMEKDELRERMALDRSNHGAFCACPLCNVEDGGSDAEG